RRQVHLRLTDALEAAEADIADDADDLSTLKRQDVELTTDWILPRPVALDERFAHDRHTGAIDGVRLADVAAPLDWNPHRRKVAGRHETDAGDVVQRSKIDVAAFGIAFHANRPDAAAHRRHRQKTDEAGRLDAGERSHFVDHARVERFTRRQTVSRAGQFRA